MTRLGVVMAGGRGRRLAAGVPKALVTLAGRTLLERAIDVLEAVCDDVRVAAPADLALPIAPRRRVADAPGGGGPLAGLVGALASGEHEVAIVLGVDFPFVEPDTLRGLAAALGGSPAVLPAPGGIPQPLVAVYAGRSGPSFARAWEEGERSITRAALALAPRVLEGPALVALPGGQEAFFNLNTPEDLSAAEARLARAPGGARR